MRKKILIFYSKTGAGHLRAAEAIRNELKGLDTQLEIVLSDGLEKTNLGLKTNPGLSFLILVNYLIYFYNLFYLLSNNKAGVRILRVFIKGVWGRNFKKIIALEKPDLIISTHHFISPSTISGFKHQVPFILVATDLGIPHRIWFDQKASQIIVPTERMLNFGKKVLGKKNINLIKKINYPIQDNTSRPLKKLQIKNTLLVIGGGTGAGSMKAIVQTLLNNFPEKKLVVVCGNNNFLYKKILKFIKEKDRIYRFVDNLAELMLTADIIITKAGPGTIIQAINLRRPVIITNWVGIQERDNIKFIKENHLGIYCPKVNKLPEAIYDIYNNYEDFISLTQDFKNGAKQIAEFILTS